MSQLVYAIDLESRFQLYRKRYVFTFGMVISDTITERQLWIRGRVYGR